MGWHCEYLPKGHCTLGLGCAPIYSPKKRSLLLWASVSSCPEWMTGKAPTWLGGCEGQALTKPFSYRRIVTIELWDRMETRLCYLSLYRGGLQVRN